jgi:hypothetical protein
MKNLRSYLGNNHGLGFAHRLACPTPQAISGPRGERLDSEIKNVSWTVFDAFFTSIALVRIHVHQIDFKIDILFRHPKSSFILPKTELKNRPPISP